MLGKQGEDLLKCASGNSEVLKLAIASGLAQVVEQVGETANMRRVYITFDLVSDFVANVTDFSHEWHVLSHIRLTALVGQILDHNRVAQAILGFQVAWTAIANKSAIYHNHDLVAELLSLIHSVCSQNHRDIFHLLKQFEKASSRNWVDSSSWLVHELDMRAANQRHCTYQLSLVATTEVLCNCVNKRFEV